MSLLQKQESSQLKEINFSPDDEVCQAVDVNPARSSECLPQKSADPVKVDLFRSASFKFDLKHNFFKTESKQWKDNKITAASKTT